MEIACVVKDLIQKYQTRDVRELSEALGIKLYFREDFDRLLGMYAVIAKRRCVFLNANMSEIDTKMVLAHEIGHDILHRGEEEDFAEFTLFRIKNEREYEANIFAAHLLLDDEAVLQLAREGGDVFSIAQILEVDVNLLLIKLHEMKRNGEDLPYRELPPRDFMGHL